MKERYHHFIHDKLASTLMIITLTFSFFIMLNVVKIQNEQKIGEQQLEKERYASQLIYQFNSEDADGYPGVNISENELEIKAGNVIITDTYNQIGDADYYAATSIVMAYNEPLVEELAEGRYPSETEVLHKRRCVVVGSELLRFTRQEGKQRVLSIDGIDYEVLGVLKDITGNKMDNRLIVFYDCLAQQTKHDVERGLGEGITFTILYGSNEAMLNESMANEIQELENWLYRSADRTYISLLEEGEELENYSLETVNMMRDYNKYTLYAMFAICMCACFLVSSVWIKRRRKELVIRKALGSSFRNIRGVLLKDLGIMIGISLLLDVILLAIQILITGNNWVREEYIVDNIGNILFVCGIVLVVTMIRPLYVVAKISPAEGTRAL